jgi:hypothetical protein
MNKSAEKLLTELYSNYQNLGEIVKHEKDPKLLKSYETEMNKINNLTRSLTSYINYYKIKELKK